MRDFPLGVDVNAAINLESDEEDPAEPSTWSDLTGSEAAFHTSISCAF